MNRRLVILGASARAAACSAQQAGLLPAAADLFGDRDLMAIAEWTTTIEDYPRGVPAAAERLPAAPWIYTGGLENHPHLIDRVAATRPLLGNPGNVLRSVRDPFRVAPCLREIGLDVPDISRDPPPPGTAEVWLRKPLGSSGGRGIRRFDPNLRQAIASETTADVYYQRFIRGRSYSAVFIAASGVARLIGVTRQLTGESWTGAKSFAYCGSLGPLRLDASRRSGFERIGNRLAESFGLIGLWGVDVIVDGPRIYVIEVNPRFVASVEVLERAFSGRRRLMQEHIDACCTGLLPSNSESAAMAVCGKAILFATRPVRISDRFSTLVQRMNHNAFWPPLADIPHDETRIEAGYPVLTLRTEAATSQLAKRRLQRLASAVRKALSESRR